MVDTHESPHNVDTEAEAFRALLIKLPRSYAGPTCLHTAPYGLVGTGEGTLAASLARPLVPERMVGARGTQFVTGSPDAAPTVREYATRAQATGAGVRRIATGGDASSIDLLVPSGVLGAYHGAQAVAYGSGHAEAARAADDLLAALAQACAGEDIEGNPALELAWKLRHRTPLLLTDEGGEDLAMAWQQVLARVGKSYSQPVLGDPLATVTGMFEARHEQGDGKVAVILGDLSPRLDICREVLETRLDEVVHLPYPAVLTEPEGSLYASTLALWYLGVWTAYHLAVLDEQSPADAPALAEALRVLTGE